MKTTIRFLIVSSFVVAQLSIAQWVQTNGPFGADVHALAAFDNNLFAGTWAGGGGIFLSTNNGTSWSNAAAGYTDNFKYVSAFATVGTTLFAGTQSGIYLSTDNGTSWSKANTGPANERVNAFVVAGTRIFSGTYGGVYCSTNNGTSWTAFNTGLTDTTVLSLASSGTNLFAGTMGGVFLSTDNGSSWTAVSNGLSGNALMIRALMVSGANLFAGTSGGVYRTTNNGTSWDTLNTGLDGPYGPNNPRPVFSLVTDGTRLFAGTWDNGGVYLSTDSGASWTAANTGLTNKFINTLAAIPNGTGGTNLFAGTSGGVFLSSDSGASWTAVNTGMIETGVNALTVDGTDLLAGTMYSGVFRSTNYGTDWNVLNTGLTYVYGVSSLVVSGTNLFAGTGDGVYRSTDQGASWTAVNNGLTSTVIASLAVSGTTLFAGTTYNGGIFRSTDNGANWTAVDSAVTDKGIWAFAVIGTNVFAGGVDSGVFVSTNNGTNWTAVNEGLTDRRVQALAVSGTDLFAGTRDGVFRSTNNGTSWASANSGMWSRTSVNSFSISGTNIFAGTGAGVYLSTDQGGSWTVIDNDRPYNPARSVAVSGNSLYVGTQSSGVWRRSLSDMGIVVPAFQNLVEVAAGTFTAGTTPVTISRFNIEKYEVTYELWTEVRNWALTHGYASTDLAAGRNGYNPVGTNHPVTEVNWYEAVKWCNARSEKEGLTPVYYTDAGQTTVYRSGHLDINSDAVKWNADGFRLPTEAEWEFAARGGTSSQGFTYSGGNTLDSVGWYATNSGLVTHSAGTNGANELGLYDMSGNSAEWCWDWWSSTYPSPGTTDPKGPATAQSFRIQRGGSFFQVSAYGRVADRGSQNPTAQSYTEGLRCAQTYVVKTGIGIREHNVPSKFSLGQNYPNPFNPSTTITFGLPSQAFVSLKVFDMIGREVTTLVSEELNAGYHSRNWNAEGLSSGVYFYRIQAGHFVETKKLILLK